LEQAAIIGHNGSHENGVLAAVDQRRGMAWKQVACTSGLTSFNRARPASRLKPLRAETPPSLQGESR
jgi:hypothetical protein